MQAIRSRYTIAALLMFLTAGIIFFYNNVRSTVVYTDKMIEIPSQVGEWKSNEIPVEDKYIEILQTRNIIMREYFNSSGDKIGVTIVHYRADRVELHLPERCLVGQGSNIIERGKERVQLDGREDGFSVNRLLLSGKWGNNIVIYYFASGEYLTSSYFRLKLRMAINKIRGRRNSGSLIEFSTKVSVSKEQSAGILKEFVKQMQPLLFNSLQ